MKTAEEFYDYLKQHGYKRSILNKGLILQRLREIENSLLDDEEVYMCFIGQEISDNNTPSWFYNIFTISYNKIYACALTNRRIIAVYISGIIIKHKKVLSVYLNHLNDITKIDKLFFTYIEIDTIKETLHFAFNKSYGLKTYDLLLKKLHKVRVKQENKLINNKDNKENKHKKYDNKNLYQNNESLLVENENSKERVLKKIDTINKMYKEGMLSETQKELKIQEIIDKNLNKT